MLDAYSCALASMSGSQPTMAMGGSAAGWSAKMPKLISRRTSLCSNTMSQHNSPSKQSQLLPSPSQMPHASTIEPSAQPVPSPSDEPSARSPVVMGDPPLPSPPLDVWPPLPSFVSVPPLLLSAPPAPLCAPPLPSVAPPVPDCAVSEPPVASIVASPPLAVSPSPLPSSGLEHAMSRAAKEHTAVARHGCARRAILAITSARHLEPTAVIVPHGTRLRLVEGRNPRAASR